MPSLLVHCKRHAQQLLECWMSYKVQHLLMLCFYPAQLANLELLPALVNIVLKEALAIVMAKRRILLCMLFEPAEHD